MRPILPPAHCPICGTTDRRRWAWRLARSGVGIVGTGGWAKYGHIAALKTLEEFEVVAIGSRTQATADAVARDYDIAHAFSDEQALIPARR